MAIKQPFKRTVLSSEMVYGRAASHIGKLEYKERRSYVEKGNVLALVKQ